LLAEQIRLEVAARSFFNLRYRNSGTMCISNSVLGLLQHLGFIFDVAGLPEIFLDPLLKPFRKIDIGHGVFPFRRSPLA
jgi:hypothetical protein